MAKVNLKKKLQFWGTGRRKKAIARVRLIPAGSGTIVINDRTFEDYFPQGTLQYIVKQPLVLLEAENKYDDNSVGADMFEGMEEVEEPEGAEMQESSELKVDADGVVQETETAKAD